MGGRQAHLLPRRWVFPPLKSPALLAVLAAACTGLPINFSVRVSMPSDSFVYLGLQMRNCGSQLFCPHFIRTEKASLPGQKAASSGRTRSLAGKRDPGYRGRLLCSSLSLRAGVLLVSNSAGRRTPGLCCLSLSR